MVEHTGHVVVVGAGLAGSEAAMSLANNGIKVSLVESKTLTPNPSQKLKTFCELVCTNSLKSLNPSSGHGLLKYDMEKLDSLVLKCAHETRVPAGDALAVDRERFSELVTKKLKEHPLITLIEADVSNPLQLKEELEADYIIVATGPLTTSGLEAWLVENLAKEDFYFYDAIAPIVDAESLDYSKLYFKDRYKDDQGEEADYLNAPMTETQYYEFVEALVSAEKVPAQSFEDYKFFEACLPIDIMAERGKETPRFSCMKPVGLERVGEEAPYAVVQLRRENLLGSAYNMVGFQTRLKYPEQKRVFRMIPGLESAEFVHLGSVHRNSFINAKKLLNWDLSSKEHPELFFAGQITGVEGYTESASMGLYVAWQIRRRLEGKQELKTWPADTGIGALVNYIMTCERPSPSSINFGLLPTITLTKEQRKARRRKSLKKELVSMRAQKSTDAFLNQTDHA